MSHGSEKLKVILSKMGEHPTTEGLLTIKHFSSGERLGRAAKLVGLFVALAIVSVFIPVLHFFLVPIFLILAGIMGLITYSQKAELLESIGQCPYCSKETRFKQGSSQLPFNDSCEICSELIIIQCP